MNNTNTKLGFLLAVFLAAAPLAGRLAPQSTSRPSPVSTPIVYEVPGMELVTVQRDVVYKTVDNTQLKLDLYLPPPSAGSGKAPAILLISGNALPRRWLSFESTARVLAAHGMAAILFDKRYSRGSYYDTESDLADLLAFLRERGGEIGIDATRQCVMAYSGGGPLLSVFLRRMQPPARCMVAFYADLDANEWGVPAGADRDQAMQDFSPLVQVRIRGRAAPPFLAVKAGLDQPELNATFDRFARETSNSDAPVEFLEHAQGRHGFDFLDNNERSRELIRATIEFLRAHLR